MNDTSSSYEPTGEPKGAINVYRCRGGHVAITELIDAGTTPMLMPCTTPKCQCLMRSSFYDAATREQFPGDPTHEWFRPERLGSHVSPAVREHVRRGGLLLRSKHAPIVGLDEKVGRNDLCPCGSGKKFKRCCLNSLQQYREQAVKQAPYVSKAQKADRLYSVARIAAATTMLRGL